MSRESHCFPVPAHHADSGTLSLTQGYKQRNECRAADTAIIHLACIDDDARLFVCIISEDFLSVLGAPARPLTPAAPVHSVHSCPRFDSGPRSPDE